jgi:hypothetical protein
VFLLNAGAKTMYAKSRAFIVHRTPCRLRIKIPERQRQLSYFTALQRILVSQPHVLSVEVNPLAASVVINCRPGFDLSTLHNRFIGLQVLPPPNAGSAARQVCRRAVELNAAIRAFSGGDVGLASFIIKLVIAIATKQVGAQLIEWAAEALVQAAKQQSSPALSPTAAA